MTKRPGHLWQVIQAWLDSIPRHYGKPSQNKLAADLGVSASSLGDYKYAEHMPPAAFLYRLAEHIQVPYEVVLDATLKDHGYRQPSKLEQDLGQLGGKDRREMESYLAQRDQGDQEPPSEAVATSPR